MLDEGAYATVSEIADAENISKSYISRIMRLALLAPDLVEAILAGKADQAPTLEALERPLPASWEEQRACKWGLAAGFSHRILAEFRHQDLDRATTGVIRVRQIRWFGTPRSGDDGDGFI